MRGPFCCNYISYFYWSSLLFGICLADILWICQKAFTEWAPPVCLYQMCCILNFHWISSRYFHKIPLNPHPFPTHKCYWKCHNIFTTSWFTLGILGTGQGTKTVEFSEILELSTGLFELEFDTKRVVSHFEEWPLSLEIMCKYSILSGPHNYLHISKGFGFIIKKIET